MNMATAFDHAQLAKGLFDGSLGGCGLPPTHSVSVSTYRMDTHSIVFCLSRPPCCSGDPSGGAFMTPHASERVLVTRLEARFSPQYPEVPCAWSVVAPAGGQTELSFRPSVLKEMMQHMAMASSTAPERLRQDARYASLSPLPVSPCTTPLEAAAYFYIRWWSLLAVDDTNTASGPALSAAWANSTFASDPWGAPVMSSPCSPNNMSSLISHRSARSSTVTPRVAGIFLPDGRVLLWNVPAEDPILTTMGRRAHSCTNVVQMATSGGGSVAHASSPDASQPIGVDDAMAPAAVPSTHRLLDTRGEVFLAPARRTNTMDELMSASVSTTVGNSSQRTQQHMSPVRIVAVGLSVVMLRRLGKKAAAAGDERLYDTDRRLLFRLPPIIEFVVLNGPSPSHALMQNCALLSRGGSRQAVGKCFRTLARLAEGLMTFKPDAPPVLSATLRVPNPKGCSAFAVSMVVPSVAAILSRIVALCRASQADDGCFWAGVGLCALLLPLLSAEKTLSTPSNRRVVDMIIAALAPQWCSTVSRVAFVFDMFRDVVRACETHLLEDYMHALRGNACTTDGCSNGVVSSIRCPLFASHSPISECSVCKAPLRCTRSHRSSAAGQPGGLWSPLTLTQSSAATQVQMSDVPGELVVQCIHCGHGGHYQHLLEWYASPLTDAMTCPEGCNCLCVY